MLCCSAEPTPKAALWAGAEVTERSRAGIPHVQSEAVVEWVTYMRTFQYLRLQQVLITGTAFCDEINSFMLLTSITHSHEIQVQL